MEQVKIFDATLYGGGQSPGVGLNLEEKLEIARLLEQMGVKATAFPICIIISFLVPENLYESGNDWS